eukprot:tig00020675_g12704.t1
MSLIRRSVLHRADSTVRSGFAPTSRTICERLQKSISTAEPSPPPPEGHPPRARDGQRCGRLRILTKFSMELAPSYLSVPAMPHTSTATSTRKALVFRQPAQPAHEPQSNLAIGRPSPQPVAPPAAVRRGSTPTDLLAAARYLGQHQRHEEISQSAQWPRPPAPSQQAGSPRVSPFDFDVLLFPIHSPGHWTFAAIHSRLERSWPRFSAGSSSSAGNATSPQTTPPPGRLHRPPDALPQANGPQHPDPAPEADRRRQALPPD